MSDLFWPGAERAGGHLDPAALVGAMLRVEEAWLDILVTEGVAPPAARHPLGFDTGRLEDLAVAAESSGTPVPALLTMLRDDLDLPVETTRWLHRGLTSQDVVDSALMWLLRAAVRDLRLAMEQQIVVLADLAREHRMTPRVARTLTQPAVPSTFGLTVATWLTGLLDAYEEVVALVFPVQVGGAGGTMAAAIELGLDPSSARAGLAQRLGLSEAPPWHTTRTATTRAGDALVRCTDAWGHLTRDVLTGSRSEVGELSEGAGGGSSTMPHKANPVLSVLIRRAALSTPQLAATLHLAAAEQIDERADGGWHVEWATLRDLTRRTLTAAGQATDLVSGLVVHTDAMAANLDRVREDALAEQRSLTALTGREPVGDYLGEAGGLVDAVLARAHTLLEERR